tara:strand:+ start:11737 stop:14187 length:2451 start_codon:yes stop_codon:yes gene_type:complete
MSHFIRVLCDSRDSSSIVTDAITRQIPFFWSGTGFDFQLALTSGDTFVTSPNIQTIAIEIKPLGATPLSVPLVRKVYSAADTDAGFTGDQWAGGVESFLVATFTASDASIGAGDYRLIVVGIDWDDVETVYLSTKIVNGEDYYNGPSVIAPPTPGASYYDKTEADARFAALTAAEDKLSFGATQALTITEKRQLGENWPEAVAVQVTANLHLPNYDAEQSTLHIDVKQFENRKWGWRYWAVHSPIYGETNSAPLEAPVIMVSNDGENWQLPEGGSDILDRFTRVTKGTLTTPNSGDLNGKGWQHDADPDLIEVMDGGASDGNLRCYWLAVNDTDNVPTGRVAGHALVAAETSDGINWTLLGPDNDGYLFETVGHRITSPSIVVDQAAIASERYRLFGGITVGGGSDMGYRVSADGINWGVENPCTLPAGAEPWHNNVVIHGTVYFMMIATKPLGTRNSGELRALFSVDQGVTWTGLDKSFHDDYINWPKDLAGGGVYRGSFVVREDNLWDIWFSILVTTGSGDGDSSGDVGSNPDKFNSSRIALARGVDPLADNVFKFTAAADHDSLMAPRALPLIEKEGQLSEIWNGTVGRKGWSWKWTTPYPAGILTGGNERITPGIKHLMAPGTNKGKGSVQGRFRLDGVIDETAVALDATSGNPAVVESFKSGNVKFSGHQRWTVTMSATPENYVISEGTLMEAADAGSVVTGAVATVSAMNGPGQFFPRSPSGTVHYAVGNRLYATPPGGARELLTHSGGTPVTITAIGQAPIADGVNVLFHFWDEADVNNPSGGLDGGFVEIWNSSAFSFHGNLSFTSFR